MEDAEEGRQRRNRRFPFQYSDWDLEASLNARIAVAEQHSWR